MLSLRSKRVGRIDRRTRNYSTTKIVIGLFVQKVCNILHMVFSHMKSSESPAGLSWDMSGRRFVAGRVVAVASFGIASTCAARSMELRFRSVRSMLKQTFTQKFETSSPQDRRLQCGV